MYEFVRCAPDKRFPEACSWYLKVSVDDQELFETVHHAMSLSLYRRADCDPHVTKFPDYYNMVSMAHLGGLWAKGFEMMATKYDTVYVNSVFGFLPEPPTNVLASRNSRKLEWPTEVKGWITIQRWAGRPHWYLSTRDGRTFDPPKHNTLEGARRHAEKLVPAGRIEIKSEGAGRKPLEGD